MLRRPEAVRKQQAKAARARDRAKVAAALHSEPDDVLHNLQLNTDSVRKRYTTAALAIHQKYKLGPKPTPLAIDAAVVKEWNLQYARASRRADLELIYYSVRHHFRLPMPYFQEVQGRRKGTGGQQQIILATLSATKRPY